MKLRWVTITGLSTFTVAFGCLAITGQSAIAQTSNTWDYAIDSSTDGVSDSQVGGGIYEFYGMAILEDSNNIVIALNANFPLTGVASGSAADGVVSWGDLFFNFSGDDFNTASSNGDLYAINFSETNNSGVPTLGVYSSVTATSVTSTNDGFSSLDSYNDYVTDAGGTPSLGNLAATDPYFDQTGAVQNVMGTGTFAGEITFLNSTQLSGYNLDFADQGATGTQTIGFSFNKSDLPTGDFIASIFAECANDGMALEGEIKEVPEPMSILGSLAGVGLIARQKWRKRNQAS